MRCDHCGEQVPEGIFCTRCGAHQGTLVGVGDKRLRLHRYAAHPGEHVATPNVVTTLLPHATGHKVHEFRLAALAGIVVVGVLAATGIIVGAILVSAVLIPALYLMYLYEAQVYRDEPARVLGMTIGGGVVLGVLFTVIADRVFSPTVSSRGYLSFGDELVATVLIPLIQLIVLVAPALLLRGAPAFGETADGLVFGVAAGLGFTASESLVRFSSVIGDLPVRTDAANWIYPLLTICVLLPLLHGSAAGAIAASVWSGAPRRRSRVYATMGIPVAVIATVGFYLVGQVLTDHGVSGITLLGWQAVPVLTLVVFIRFLLHHALLDEAEDMGFHPALCSNCHHHVMAAGFCPSCGMALSAGPKREPIQAPASTTGAAVAGEA